MQTPRNSAPPTPLGILVLLETTLMHELSLLEILDCVFGLCLRAIQRAREGVGEMELVEYVGGVE